MSLSLSPSVEGQMSTSRRATDAELARCFARERAHWACVDPTLGRFVDRSAEFVMCGGKRLRSLLVHAAFISCDGYPDDPRVARVGAAVELLHAFALLHDDVMDGSDRRRGRASFHRSAADEHESRGGTGEARRYGEGMATLAGDLLHVYADGLMATMPLAVRRIWLDLRIEVMMGQHLDLEGTATSNRDPHRACLVAEHKTARYTVERPLHLGAALAGSFASVGPALSAYGEPLGVAFQHRDDLLGAFGDVEATGKPVGDDLREGKPTLLLALAWERASARQRTVLDRVGDADLSEHEVELIREVLVETGAVQTIERTIDELRDRSLAALEAASLRADGKQLLADLSRVLTERDR
jgi:geranylgeranyl diphosphate synthase, type I